MAVTAPSEARDPRQALSMRHAAGEDELGPVAMPYARRASARAKNAAALSKNALSATVRPN